MDERERLIEENRTAVERYVKARISNYADAEDILQETLMAAWRGYPGLRERTAFLAWMLGVARRKCADYYRIRSRRREVLTDTLPDRPEELPDGPPVEETLENLPERDRLMLKLFYMDRLSQKQIAGRLRIPEGTVKSRMNTARSRFRAAYPYPPRGEMKMKKLPKTLPEYKITWKGEAPFPVDCSELTGWFIVPRPGEKLLWGMYDLPSRKLDVAYDMAVTGPASVHGLEGVAIRAKVIPPEKAAGAEEPIRDAVDASTGGQEEWTFIAQEKDGYTRFLAAEHLEDGIRKISTFLDGEEFMDNWGFGEENRGTPVHLESRGTIQRNGRNVTAPAEPFVRDIAGRCEVTLDGKVYDTVCLMDLGAYDRDTFSEQYICRDGRTVLWRRFNCDDWAVSRYGKRWSELLPENERLTINGRLYIHWYDCLCVR